MTRLHVSDHVDGVSSSGRGNGTADEVLQERLLLWQTLALGNTTEDELRSLGDGGQGVDVRRATRLASDEAEEEGEDDGQNAGAGVHVELNVAHDDGKGNGEERAGDPVDGTDLVLGRRRVVDLTLELANGLATNLVADGEASVAAAAVDGATVAGKLSDGYTEPEGGGSARRQQLILSNNPTPIQWISLT